MALFSRSKGNHDTNPTARHGAPEKLSRRTLHRLTARRKHLAAFTSFLLFISFIFLILVEIGNVKDRRVLRDVYFFKLDVSGIIPTIVTNPRLVNSFAQSIGLHDFYQVGLWDFCEGYVGEGITGCSKPKTLYWFNPVEILVGELLSGATISLPSKVVTYLKIIRLASRVMFGFFLTATVTSFIGIFLAPLSLYSRLGAIPIAFFCLMTALLSGIAAAISTAMWTIFKNAVVDNGTSLGITAEVGLKMFVFQWIAAGCAIIAAIFQCGLCCCCTSRRDVRTGREGGGIVREEEEEKTKDTISP